jgi:hypothetical protein
MVHQGSDQAERKAVAAFYSKIGKLPAPTTPNPQLPLSIAIMMKCSTRGRLLLKRERPMAGEELAMIPASSKYYSEAQRLIARWQPVETLDKARIHLPPLLQNPSTAEAHKLLQQSPQVIRKHQRLPHKQSVDAENQALGCFGRARTQVFCGYHHHLVSLLVILIILIS